MIKILSARRRQRTSGQDLINIRSSLQILVVEEIEATGDEIKKNHLLDLIKGFEKLSSKGEEIETLTEEYVKRGIIPVKHIEDAIHIAVTTVYSLDVLVSWNFEHIVKLKTKREINAVNVLLGYNQLEIVEPTML